MPTKMDHSDGVAVSSQGADDLLGQRAEGNTEAEGDVVGELKPSPSKSPRRTSNQLLQVVEEGRAMDASERWSCPASCPFPTSGHHGLGCTRIHKDFDFDLCDLSEHHFVNNRRIKDDMPEATNSTMEEPDRPPASVSFDSELTDNQKRLRYRRRAQCLLMVSLTLGTLILLLVWLVPPAILKEDGPEKGDQQGLEQTLNFTEAGSIGQEAETELFAEP